MNKRINSWIIAISFLLLFIQPFFTWFTADDFCFIQRVKADGLIRNMWYEYLNWDGRSISLTYPVCRLGVWLELHWLGPLIATSLLYLTAVVVLQLSGINNGSFWQKRGNEVVMAAALWLMCFYFSSQTLYWTTGIGYHLDVVLLFTCFWWIGRWTGSKTDYLIGLPVFFYTGTCSPNGVLAAMLILALQWFYESMVKGNKNHRKYLYAFALIFAAFLMVVMSPGNSRRMTGWDWNNLTHIWTIYFNVKLILGNIISYNSPMLWIFLAAGLFGSAAEYSAEHKDANPGFVKKVLTICYVNRFLLAALVSAFFFLPLPGLNAPRTNIQFAMFIALYGASKTHLIADFFRKNGAESGVSVLKTALLVVFAMVAASQLFDAAYVKRQLAERDRRLRALKGEHVVLNESDMVRTPRTRRFEDVGADSSYWLNRCVSDYYGLKSVKIKVDGQKKESTGYYTD